MSQSLWTVIDLGTLPTAPGTELKLEQDGALIRRSVLPGGIRVLTEHIPASRSAAVGAWVAAGSRDERDEEAGSTHFLEHLLFKGTPSRTAYDISSAFDAVGGDANAATAKNYTFYYARVLDADLPMAIEVLLDMVTSSSLSEAHFEVERGVILEELAMMLDDPSDLVHERFTETLLAGHPLGRPIGGTPSSIGTLPHAAVLEHYRRTYVPSELVVTAAGNVDHDAVVRWVIEGARRGGWVLSGDDVPAARRQAGDVVYGPGKSVFFERNVEQAHAILGWPGVANSDPRRFALGVANTILGGGMSSRLFQEIREKRGLAYSTYAFSSQYAEGGVVGLFAASSPRSMAQVVEVLRDEAQRMVSEPVGADELARAIGQIRGNYVLSLEDSGSRMTRLGLAEIVTGRLLSFDETLRNYAEVTTDDVLRVSSELMGGEPTLVVVGPGAAGAAL
ncbi:MAG TPA: pitrilysin family protein [Actinomycetaceae bacterium]|nr:pitrilysin family protein [Actinomycetaceae bacterium]